MTATKTYRIAVRKGRKMIDEIFPINDIREGLKERGLNKTDIETGINIMACIVFFDKLLFPKERIENFQFCYLKVKGSFAAYCHSDSGFCSKEIYQVRVKDLKDNLSEYNQPVISFKRDGIPDYRLCKEYPKANCKEKILSIAAHEVRHRVQKKMNVLLFEKDKTYANRRIDGYVFYCKGSFENGHEQPYSDCSEKILKEEFDARVIDHMVLWAAHEGIDPYDLYWVIGIGVY